MFKRILLGFDGSEHAQRAAKLAARFAQMEKDVAVWLVVVVEPLPTGIGKPYFNQLIVEQTSLGNELIEIGKKAFGKGVPLQTELVFGSPAESIIDMAKKHDCDLIIMGTRGLGGLRGLLLGSQTHKVISLAHCPVLAVK